MRISTVATISLASLGSLASCAAIEKRDYATYKNTVRAVNMHNSTARAVNGSLAEIGTQAVVEVDVKGDWFLFQKAECSVLTSAKWLRISKPSHHCQQI